jgi:hypothetical protein
MVQGLLDSARTGTSALAVRSEAGIGETALLDYLARRAECRVIRAAGVEARWGLRSRCSISSACRCSRGSCGCPRHEEALSTAFGLTVLESLRMPWSAS